MIFFNTALVARALTGGVSRVAAQVAPRPHPALVVPPGAAIAFGRAVAEEESALMAPRVDGWCRPLCSMAHASTGGIGVAAWAALTGGVGRVA